MGRCVLGFGFAACLLASSASAAPIRVAVEYSAASVMSLQGANKVAAQLNDDTFFDFTATTVTGTQIDTLGELNLYDVVVIGDGGDGGNDDLAVFSAALNAWVMGGGGVVGAGWLIWEAGATTGPTPPNAAIDAIIPVNTAGPYNFVNNVTQQITNSAHPVTAGVNDFLVVGCCIEYPTAPQVDPWGTVLGVASGQPTIVAGQIGLGRSVYLGPTYMAGSGYTGSLYAGDPDRLMEQAVAWAARPAVAPEPTVLSLMAIGVGFIGRRHIRRRRR